MLLAKLAFDNNASDECVVQDAWLAIVNAYQSSSFFGINPGIKKIPMTAIFWSDKYQIIQCSHYHLVLMNKIKMLFFLEA